MIGTVLLIIRLALTVTLYIFLGWAFLTMWRDLRAQTRLISSSTTPLLTVRIERAAGEEVHQYTHSPITVGREGVCECVIDDPTVSLRHARFSYHHNQWWLADMGSTNGTLLNGQPVTEAVVLINDDQVRCGQVNISVNIALDNPEAQSSSLSAV